MRYFMLAAMALMALAFPSITAAQAEQAQIRVLQLSPETGAVDLYVDGESVATNIAFPTASAYVAVAPGEHTVQLVPAGEGLDAALVTATVDLRRNKPYSVTALKEDGALQATILADTTKSVPAGMARVRIVHAAPDTKSVDIWTTGAQTPLLTDQGFGSADYVNIPAGTYEFEVANAGTSDVLLKSQSLRLEPNWVYTLAVAGNSLGDDVPLRLQAMIDKTSSS